MEEAKEQAEAEQEKVEAIEAEAQEKREAAQAVADAGGSPDEAEGLLAEARALEEKADRKQEVQASYARRAEKAEAQWREVIEDERTRLRGEAKKEAATLQSSICDAMEELQGAIEELEDLDQRATLTRARFIIPKVRTVNGTAPSRLPEYVKRTRERVSKVLDA